MNILKNYGARIFESWKRDVDKKAAALYERNENSLVLDVGCGDGKITSLFSKKIGNRKRISGMEGISALVEKSRKNGIDCKLGNIEEKFPFKNNSFDVVISHFSLEHVVNIEQFVSEIFRVLKQGGYTVIATDNLSSWANIIALLFGFEPFSLTPGIADIVIGNPFALRYKESGISWAEKSEIGHGKPVLPGVEGHVRVLAYQAFKEVMLYKGFTIETIVGAGYPIPVKNISSTVSSLDPRHAHFLVGKFRKITT